MANKPTPAQNPSTDIVPKTISILKNEAPAFLETKSAAPAVFPEAVQALVGGE